jgi:hypothetical protein
MVKTPDQQAVIFYQPLGCLLTSGALAERLAVHLPLVRQL